MDAVTSTFSTTFSSLRHPNYRLWFFGQLISLVGTWMQNAAQGFLVYSLTQSPAFLGYVGLISGLPSWLFMLYSGVIADRFPRRAVMLVTQSAMMALAFVLAGLVFAGAVQPWHILVLAFLGGTAKAFEIPARQSFVVELVGREDMTNAIALNTIMINTGIVTGPAIAGVVYVLVGPGWCFLINGVSYLAVILALVLMDIEPKPAPSSRPNALTAFAEGIRYIRSQPLVMTLTIGTLVYYFIDYGLLTLIPAWAVRVVGGDAATNGLLLTANGAGAVVAGLIVASSARRVGSGKLWAIFSFAAPLVTAAFALSRSVPLSLVLMAGVSLANVTLTNTSNAMVQTHIPDELRGRVMGFYSLVVMSSVPLGSLLIDVAADRAGEVNVTLFWAGVLALFAVYMWIRKPELREQV